MSENKIVLTEKSLGSGRDSYLSLSIPKERFGEFIGSLLDQPIELSRSSYREFDVDRDWIEQTINIVNQRIRQQNISEIVSFSGFIGFKEGELVKFNSLNQFLGYVPSAAKYSISFEIKISFLVEFPTKTTPEKQNIIIGASDRDVQRDKGARYSSAEGMIWYRVECTERTWGEDIEKILWERMQAAIVQESAGERVFRAIKGYVGFLIGAGAILVPLTLESFRVSQVRDSIPIPAFDSSLDAAQAISIVLNFFQSYLEAGINFYHIIFYVVFGVGLIGFAFYIAELGEGRYYFVSLTEKSKDNANKRRKAQRKMPFAFVRDIVIGIVSSSIVSYLFLRFGATLV